MLYSHMIRSLEMIIIIIRSLEMILIITELGPHKILSPIKSMIKIENRGFPGGPVVKNLPYNAGDVGSIPGRGTEIPHAMGQLSSCTSTKEPVCRKLQSLPTLEPMCHNYRAHVPWILCTTTKEEKTHMQQLERNPHVTTKSPHTATKDPACPNEDPMCHN